MINIWGSDINYTPDYWPLWLVILAVLAALTLAGVAGHFMLRKVLAPKREAAGEHKLYLYSLPVRVWHWLNALLFAVLLATGLTNHFGPSPMLVKIHHIAGQVFVAVWIYFIVINIFTGNGKHYLIQLSGFTGRIIRQGMFYLFGIMKGEPHPFHSSETCKFNPLQQVAYAGVVYVLMPILAVSGLLALYPEFMGLAGMKGMAVRVHLAFGVISLIFIIAHLYLCTCGGYMTQLLKGMIDGYHREDSTEKH
jgi:thiosulfate reductase cytochrome b subunit